MKEVIDLDEFNPMEKQRTEVATPTYAEFLERTRRVFRLLHRDRSSGGKYARGLESKPEDYA